MFGQIDAVRGEPIIMSDFVVLMNKQNETARWKAEVENATARLELARIRERSAYLISQHEPVNSLGLDRERLRLALRYLEHGNLTRLENELEASL